MWCNTVVREHMEGSRRTEVALTGDNAELLRRIDGISRMLAHKVTNIERMVDERVEAIISARLQADPRVQAVTFKPVIEILVAAGVVHARDRRRLSQRCARLMLRFYASEGYETRVSPETGRWLFHVNGIKPWLAFEGQGIISHHIAQVSGQSVFEFVPRAVK